MKNLFLLTLFCAFITVKAQDPSFSQFYVNKLYLNPATVGSQPGLTFTSIYKNQWRAISGGAFNTIGSSLDMQMPRFSSGVGFTIFRDAVSNAALVTNGFGFSYAYILKLGDNFNMHIGLSANYLRKSIDPSKLIFSDQLDPFIGQTGSSSAIVPNEKLGVFDMGTGILARFSLNVKDVVVHNSIGFAVNHLTSPEESFLNLETRLPRRYTVHYGSMIPVAHSIAKGRSSFYISPLFKFDYQSKLKVYTVGFLTMFKPFYIGFMYQDNKFENRDTKTLIFTGGMDGQLNSKINYTFGYSYDLNITGISASAKGVHELSLKLVFLEAVLFKQKKINSKRRNTKCYEFKGKNAINLF